MLETPLLRVARSQDQVREQRIDQPKYWERGPRPRSDRPAQETNIRRSSPVSLASKSDTVEGLPSVGLGVPGEESLFNPTSTLRPPALNGTEFDHEGERDQKQG